MVGILSWFLLWVFSISTNLNSSSSGPDEALRMLVPTYIYEHHVLPNGYEPEVIYPTGNWSYAFYPQMLGAIVSAIMMSIVGIFNDSPTSLIYAARLTSVLFGAATVLIIGLSVRKALFGSKYAEVYSYVAMILLAFWPQFTFLSAYVNNDIVALLGVSLIIYASISGVKDGWAKKNSVLLGLGFTVCLLGYTNSYGFILGGAIFYLITILKQSLFTNRRAFIISLLFVISLPLVLAGPFFIRNAVIYQGDFLGLKTFKAQTTIWENANNRKVQSAYDGSIGNFVKNERYWALEQESFIGKFGYMSISPEDRLLWIYRLVVVVGIVGFMLFILKIIKSYRLSRYRDEFLLIFYVGLACGITFGLSVYYSLKIDAQPQGRYIIYILIPMLLAVTIGIKNLLDLLIPLRYKSLTLTLILTTYIVNSMIIFHRYLMV
jgi:hypothetical protein